jgi:dTDP-4-amino-4,6-dideoxygalactose transaminase
MVPASFDPGCKPAYYKYPVLLPEGADASAVRRRVLEADRIEIGSLYYPPCHLMPVFQKQLGTTAGMFPVAESLLARQVCLPMHVAVDQSAAERSVEAVRRVLAG